MLLEESIRVVFALMAVLAMIGIIAVLVRKAGIITAGGALGRKRRLNVQETLSIDARRRVAIIQCDGKEHLILLGAQSETLIASDLEPIAEEPVKEEQPAEQNPFAILKALQKRAHNEAMRQGDLGATAQKADAA